MKGSAASYLADKTTNKSVTKKRPITMKLKTNIEFSSDQREVILGFLEQLNRGMPAEQQLSVEAFCKSSVFYAIRDSNRRAQLMMETPSGTHNTESTDAAGDTTAAQSPQVSDSPALPDSQDSTNPVG